MEELFAAAQMGIEAEAFMKSNVGRYVLGRCEQEIEEAKEALTEVDPQAFLEIRELQDKIRRAQMLPNYIGELITEGQEAEFQLTENDA